MNGDGVNNEGSGMNVLSVPVDLPGGGALLVYSTRRIRFRFCGDEAIPVQGPSFLLVDSYTWGNLIGSDYWLTLQFGLEGNNSRFLTRRDVGGSDANEMLNHRSSSLHSGVTERMVGRKRNDRILH